MARKRRKDKKKRPDTNGGSRSSRTPELTVRFPAAAPLVIFALLLFLYGGALNHPFIWDDHLLLENNPQLAGWHKLPEIFSDNIGGPGYEHSFYRPLQMIAYLAGRSLWGLNPLGHHAVSIMAHALAAVALVWFLLLLFQNRLLASLAGILFAAHPIHTEAVTYISGLADPLAALGIFLTCGFTWLYGQKGRPAHWILAIVACAAALLSKEYAAITPLLILLTFWSFSKRVPWKLLGPLVIMVLAYLFVRKSGMAGTIISEENAQTTFMQRLPGIFASVFDYLRILCGPVNLHMGYGQKIFSFFDPKVLAGITIFSLSCWAVLRLKTRYPWLVFCIVWFYAALLPVMNIYPLNSYIAEHWLYVPSAGFFLLIAHLLTHLYRQTSRRTLAAVLALSLCAAWAASTIYHNRFWGDSVVFYRRVLAFNPGFTKAHSNLALIYYHDGKTAEAERHYREALRLAPGYAEARYNYGLLLYSEGKLNEAEIQYRQALKARPHYAEVHDNLAIVLAQTGRPDEAERHGREAIRLRPDYAEAHSNLGNILLMNKDWEGAKRHYRRAVALKPDYDQARANLRVLLSRKEAGAAQ